MKDKMRVISEKLKNLKSKILSAKIFNKKKKNDSEISAATENITGVEIIDEEPDGKLTSKPRMKRWKKVLLIVGGTIVSLVVIVIIVYVSLVNSGKKKLYANATSEKPSFRVTEKETDDNGEEIKELDIYIDEEGNVVIFEGTNDNETIAGTNNQNVSSGENVSGNTSGNNAGNGGNNNLESEIGSTGLKNHTVSFEGVSENSNYDIIFDGVKYAYNKDMITLLILGIDKKDIVSPAKDGISGGQSDALFLLTLNPHTQIMDIIAIPRDTIALVDIYNRDGTFQRQGYTQICLQHGYGDGMEISNERTKKTVSKLLYDLPIHSVTSINMGAVPELNDSIGGVTLESLATFEYGGYSYFEGQKIKLIGDAAYEYVHYRDTTRHNTASERLARQKQYITLFADKAISEVKKDISKVVDVYDIVKKYVVTDLSVDEMTYLASEIINYKFGEIYTLEGRLSTEYRYERYYLDKDALYEILIDKFYEKVD